MKYIILIFIVFCIYIPCIYTSGMAVYIRETDNFYLVQAHEYRLLPDVNVAKYFAWNGYSINKISQLVDVVNSYFNKDDSGYNMIKLKQPKEGKPFPTRSFASKLRGFELYKEDIRYYNTMISGYPEPLLKYELTLPEAGQFNAAIIPYDHGFLLAAQQRESLKNDSMEISFINRNFSDTSNRTVIPQVFRPVSRYIERDPRFLMLPHDNVLISFTVYCVQLGKNGDKGGRHTPWMGMRVLSHQYQMSDYHISTSLLLVNNDKLSPGVSNQRKHWAPFIYKKRLLFVHSIEPMQVMEVDEKMTPKNITIKNPYLNTNEVVYGLETSLKCSTNCANFDKLNFTSPLRGGTPAFLVRNQYLAFYHMSTAHNKVPPIFENYKEYKGFSVFAHYAIGAYTFNSDKPFRLQSISRWPITHEMFVPRQENKKVSLIILPITFWLENADGTIIDFHGEDEKEESTTIVKIVLGLHDSETVVMSMNLDRLLASLKPICR